MYRILITENGQTDVVDFGRFQAETLEEDLKNRDFTINAVAYRLHNPTDWKDPLGGRQDLKNRLLRPCSEHAFINDPVRTIRAARMALGFNLHMVPGVIQMIREASLGLKHVSAERKRDEFFKLLDSPHPASAIRLLDSFNVLPQLIPELIELKGVQQSLPHTMNVWEHTCLLSNIWINC
jgi:poly(A) polymerase